jgi:hypothetical protein
VLVGKGGTGKEEEKKKKYKKIHRSGKDGSGGKVEEKGEGVERKRREHSMEVDDMKNAKKNKLQMLGEEDRNEKIFDAGLSEQLRESQWG